MQLAQWKGEWWLSGTFLDLGINGQAFVEKQVKDFSSIPFNIYTEEEQTILRADAVFEEEIYLKFYVSGIGSVMSQNIPRTIQLMEMAELRPEEETELFYDLFSELYHPKTSRYLIENYSTKNLVYPIPISSIAPIDYVEFLLRYWNPDEFGEAVPNMRFIPERQS